VRRKRLIVAFTGSMREAQRQYFGYPADFEAFRFAGATRCTDEGEIWRGRSQQHWGIFAQRVSWLWGLKLRDAFPPKLLAPLAAKLYRLLIRLVYEPLSISPCQV